MKKRERAQTTDGKEGGFTVVESLVSFLLILLALVFMTNTIIFSLDGLQRSRLRLELSQRLEECKNRLLSVSFETDELKEGRGVTWEEPFKITRDIAAVSTTLKHITVSISYKTFTKKINFYKSRYIKEVGND